MKKLTTLIAVTALFFSCEQEELLAPHLGPALCPPAEYVLDASKLTIEGLDQNGKIDFDLGGLRLKADFINRVDWLLTFSSGHQQRQLKGTGKQLDEFWYGESSEGLFETGEVEIKLAVCNQEVVLTKEIISKPRFRNLSPEFGVLIRDWDQNGVRPVSGGTYTAADGGAGPNGSGTLELIYSDENPSPMGGKYCKLIASFPEPTWYLGYHNFNINSAINSLNVSDPKQLYLNFYVRRGEGKDVSNTIILRESGMNRIDTEELPTKSWMYYAKSFAEIGVKNGSLVGDFIFNLGPSTEKTSHLEVDYDFILITVGKPLYP